MSAYSCALRNILEFEIALVQVEYIGAHVGGEKEIHESVVVHIAHGHSTPIVKVPVGVDVEFLLQLLIIVQVVYKTCPGIAIRHQGEELIAVT